MTGDWIPFYQTLLRMTSYAMARIRLVLSTGSSTDKLGTCAPERPRSEGPNAALMHAYQDTTQLGALIAGNGEPLFFVGSILLPLHPT